METTIVRPTAWGRSFGLAGLGVLAPPPLFLSVVFSQNFQFIGGCPFIGGQYWQPVPDSTVETATGTVNTKKHTNLAGKTIDGNYGSQSIAIKRKSGWEEEIGFSATIRR
jgi:hypothetical protein